MKKEVIGKQTLYCGNSVELLDLLTDKAYGLVLTDPPYMINTKSDGNGKIDPWGDYMNAAVFYAECRHVYQGVVPFGLADGKFGDLEQEVFRHKYARIPSGLRNGGVVHAGGL